MLKRASDYDQIPFEELRMFCHFNARYLLPTVELIEFLKEQIDDKSAIEVGAGCGDLGTHLGIKMTDNYCQEWPDVKEFYKAIKQPTIKYGENVEKIDVIDAIIKYKPDIIIGAWVTQWIDPNIPPPIGGGSIYGIKEDKLLELVNTYILIGAEEIHKHKAIMKKPHTKIDAPFVRSRRKDNKIWIWKK